MCIIVKYSLFSKFIVVVRTVHDYVKLLKKSKGACIFYNIAVYIAIIVILCF